MSIEFTCTQCDKKLRTADDTVGRQVRCPACGTVQQVTNAGSQDDAQGQSGFPPRTEPSFGAPFPAPISSADNPYASPSASAFGPMPGERSAAGPRSGPAWERDRNSLASFFITLRDVAITPRWFFSTMRREGGLAGPLRFAVVGGMIGCTFMAIYGLLYQAISGANAAVAPGAFGPRRGLDPVSMFGGFCCCSGVVGPLATLAYVFLATGVFHATLALFGGARFGFESTLRVVAYSFGTMVLLGIVPICGPYLIALAQLVYLGIGLCFAHETEGWKATLAVLLPSVLCGVGCAAVIAFFVVSLAAM